MVSVSELLWPIRRPRPEGIEELAKAIAAGKAPPAAEIEATLTAARCTADDLQKAVDRHGRVIELRKRIADAAPQVKRFEVLDAELRAAADKLRRAREEHDAVLSRVGEEHFACKVQADDAARAAEELLSVANLAPTDAERLTAAEAAADAAAEQATAARQDVELCTRSLQTAEAALPAAEHEAKVSYGNADIAARAERARNAVKARGERLRDAEAKLRDAAAAEADTARKASDIRSAIRRAVIA